MRASPCPTPPQRSWSKSCSERIGLAQARGPSAPGPVTDALAVPALHLTAERDLIAPPATVASGEVVAIPSGHVGMIVGSARARLHERFAKPFRPASPRPAHTVAIDRPYRDSHRLWGESG